jgi:hypothetical protein
MQYYYYEANDLYFTYFNHDYEYYLICYYLLSIIHDELGHLISMIHRKDGIATVACLIALEVFIRIGTVWAGLCPSFQQIQKNHLFLLGLLVPRHDSG